MLGLYKVRELQNHDASLGEPEYIKKKDGTMSIGHIAAV